MVVIDGYLSHVRGKLVVSSGRCTARRAHGNGLGSVPHQASAGIGMAALPAQGHGRPLNNTMTRGCLFWPVPSAGFPGFRETDIRTAGTHAHVGPRTTLRSRPIYWPRPGFFYQLLRAAGFGLYFGANTLVRLSSIESSEILGLCVRILTLRRQHFLCFGYVTLLQSPATLSVQHIRCYRQRAYQCDWCLIFEAMPGARF